MNNGVYEKVLNFKRKYPSTIAWRLKAHSKVVEKHLNQGEKVLYVFCGQKGFSHKEIFSTCVVALTSERIIIATKRVLWGYFLTTVTPELFNDLTVYSGLIWGKVQIDTIKEVVFISNLSKKSLDEIETSVTEYMMKEKKKYARREKEEK